MQILLCIHSTMHPNHKIHLHFVILLAFYIFYFCTTTDEIPFFLIFIICFEYIFFLCNRFSESIWERQQQRQQKSSICCMHKSVVEIIKLKLLISVFTDRIGLNFIVCVWYVYVCYIRHILGKLFFFSVKRYK